MHLQSLFLALGLIAIINIGYGQLPVSEEGEWTDFREGLRLFEQGVYGKSIVSFQKFIDQKPHASSSEFQLREKEADYYIALGSAYLDRPESEKLLLDFIANYEPDPMAQQALIELANWHFDQRQYEEAYAYFDRVNTYQVDMDQRNEVMFKKGYVLFHQEKYREATGQLDPIKNQRGPYYQEVNYYLAMSHYYLGNFDAALNLFDRIEDSRKYSRFIPSYKTQIYFQREEYESVVEYAPPKLEERLTQEKDQISYILGLSYLKLNNYDRALKYLEEYAKTQRLSADDYYQIAYARYKTGDYKGAIDYFQKVSDEKNRKGQNANLYLADAYLHLEDQKSARNAFANAARRNFDPEVSEEANFNYGKLSAEMGFDREAVNALNAVPPSSDFYGESQEILSDVLLKTRDYDRAIGLIEEMEETSPKIREAYQRLNFRKAIQFMADDDIPNAKTYFDQSLRYPIDANLTARATFWLGEIEHRMENYQESSELMIRYQELEKKANRLPSVSAKFMSDYVLGYNYLKQENYRQAETFFEAASRGIFLNRSNIEEKYITRNVRADAHLRLGDCYFKRNAYAQAIESYDQAIEIRASGFVYGIYQKGLIFGLQGENDLKVSTLEKLAADFPYSPYADESLLEVGKTLTQMGQLKSALTPLQKLVDDYQKTSELIPNALVQLGLISYNLGDVEKALQYYKRVFEANPSPELSNEALIAIEEIYVNDIGDPQGYADFVEKTRGVKLERSSRDSLSYRAAEAQFENGNYAEATRSYGKYLENFPAGVYEIQAAFRKGESHLVLEQYSQAFNAYERVVEKGPSPYYSSAVKKAALIAYNHEEDFEKATQYYKKWSSVAETEEDRLKAQLGALESAYRSGKSEIVREMAKVVYENESASQQDRASAMFYKGKMDFENKAYSEALDAMNIVTDLSDNEKTAEARYLIAKIYFVQGELEVAETLSREAYKESSNYPNWVARTLILLSDILVEKEDYFNAKAALEAVIENFDQASDLKEEAERKLGEIKDLENDE